MALKRWNVHSPDKQLAKRLAEECDIDPFIAMIACGRGCTDASEIDQLLAYEPQLCDPRELADIGLAAECINSAIDAGQTFAIFGDYDCDGVMATTLMYDYLTSRGAKVIPYIPDRINEGYGMSIPAVDKLAAMGAELIVTVDNGIGCAAEIAYAAELGIRTVVTDHHIPPQELPAAVAVVDPHRADCPSSFKEVCGATVAFKLICVIADREPEELINRYSDLLAVATIADGMPLIHENRSIVRCGLQRIRYAPRTGISAILSVAGIDRDSVNAGRVSFGIAPRINAAGRIGSAERAFKLMCSSNMMEALELANQIDADNAERQRIERQITEEACEQIERHGYEYHRVIVVAGEGWSHGVIGVVASRISEKYGKPAIVISIDGDQAQGSGRSFAGFSLYEAIRACASLLCRYGGHELAAGLSLETAKIDDFRREINAYALGQPYAAPSISVDLRLNPAAMTIDMAEAIKVFEPFGAGNPTPVFGLFGVKLERITPLSNGKHQKLLFSKNDTVFQTLLFGVSSDRFCFRPGDLLDLAVTLEINRYQNNDSLAVHIRAMRLNGVDDDLLFAQLSAYHDYQIGADPDVEQLLPSREETGCVYRFVSKGPVSAERVKQLLLCNPGYGKTQIALKALCELGLVQMENGMLSAVNGAPKTNLMQSKTFIALTKGRTSE